jgi:biopolymer transport protein ExbD
MGPASPAPHGLRSEINVTPLVDVCLVLLIIFMVITPMLTEWVSIALPFGSNPDPRPQHAGQLRLSIAYGLPEVVFFGSETVPVSLTNLSERLDDLRQRKPWSEVVVRADRRLTYGEVRRILLRLRALGIREVSLAVDRRDQSERPESRNISRETTGQ